MRTDYNQSLIRSRSFVTGDLDALAFGLGFSFAGGSGPFPGNLLLEIDGERLTFPMLSFGPSPVFFGVRSSDPIDGFRISAQRGRTVHNSETFSNRPCFGPAPPLEFEVCLASGDIDRWFSSAQADILELYVAPGARSLSAASTPEPASGLAVLAALIGFLVRRRNVRRVQPCAANRLTRKAAA
jgi:hypothetical protein